MRLNQFIFSTILLCFVSYTSIAQYEVSSISEDLKKDAYIVVRDASTDWLITSPKEAVMSRREVVTYMDKKAEGETYIRLDYDEFHKITKISVKFYDKYGKSIGKAKSRAFLDISTSEGFDVGDVRAKILDFSGMEYPFTYELEYEMKHKGLLSIPSWFPVEGYHRSVEKSSISIKSKKGYQFKYKEQHLKAKKNESGEDDIVEWSVENYPAIKWEKYGVDLDEKLPILRLAPIDFELDGYAGSTRSWNDFGKWYNTILNDVEGLSESAKLDVKKLVTDDMSELEKIKKLYQHLQDNSRYVSIQLGIGGYKPFEPDFIHEKKYGDCKALSYYMHAMLKTVGVESNLVLVNAGEYAKEVDPDFPSNQFNHLFLCVPQEKDTVWLECTSQTVPFGYTGHHTSDRNVLVVNKDGGSLQRTPKYKKDDNVVVTNAVLELKATGETQGEISQQFGGLEYMDSGVSYFMNKSEKEQKKWIRNYYDISDFEIQDFKLSKGENQFFGQLKSDVHIPKFATTVGKRMFFKPIVTNRVVTEIDDPEERTSKFSISESYHHNGIYEFKIPDGFLVEKNVKDINIETKFGVYSLKPISQEGNTLGIERKFELNAGEYLAEEFVEFAAFLKKVRKADKQKVALVMDKAP